MFTSIKIQPSIHQNIIPSTIPNIILNFIIRTVFSKQILDRWEIIWVNFWQIIICKPLTSFVKHSSKPILSRISTSISTWASQHDKSGNVSNPAEPNEWSISAAKFPTTAANSKSTCANPAKFRLAFAKNNYKVFCTNFHCT